MPEGLLQYKVRIRIYFRRTRNILPHNHPVILPLPGKMTAPFAQGGLWRVRQFEQLGKLKFEPLSMSFRATEGSREIYALTGHLWSNQCEDPSIPLRFTRDDSGFGGLKQLDKLKIEPLSKLLCDFA